MAASTEALVNCVPPQAMHPAPSGARGSAEGRDWRGPEKMEATMRGAEIHRTDACRGTGLEFVGADLVRRPDLNRSTGSCSRGILESIAVLQLGDVAALFWSRNQNVLNTIAKNTQNPLPQRVRFQLIEELITRQPVRAGKH